jgi:hypothetical protein
LVTTTARIIAKKLIGVNIDIPIRREAMSIYRQKNPGLGKWLTAICSGSLRENLMRRM